MPPAPADPSNCPINELRAYLDRQAIFEQRCLAAADGEDLSQPVAAAVDVERERRYEMPLEQLLAEAQAEAATEAAKALEARRTQAATTAVSLTPAYKMCPENSKVVTEELNRRGLPGSVSDFLNLFGELAAQGKLKLNPVTLTPARVYTREELENMPLDQCREAILEMARNDVY